MYSSRTAEVLAVRPQSGACEELLVRLRDGQAKALNYLPLTGPAAAGDLVVLNTTAVELGLGSGGYHFVILNLSRPERDGSGAGHIMKLRYTPQQVKVLAVEEEASPYHAVMKEAAGLDGMPVIVAELHSMLAPLALALQEKKPGISLAYVMTDGGALPAFLSRAVSALKERGLLAGVVTCGHAFGGDLEAVTVYSGLLAAKHVLQADAAIVCMGPGVAGTGTPFGFSGLEMGDNLNRAGSLQGRPIALPRISFADPRRRHRGLSHHTLRALVTAALVAVDVPLPVLTGGEADYLSRQIADCGLAQKHRLYRYDKLTLDCLGQDYALCRTMGRTPAADPAFFLAAVATAVHTAAVLDGSVTECAAG
ncbi:MAG TPA: DUF3866 family protein [Firmicutes bacterium]|nr:DUF3866 family protein [Bacillota bacterium]